MPGLLIAGGSGDANLSWLQATAERLGIATTAVLVDPARPPILRWSLPGGEMEIGGRRLACDAAFLRYDVFSGLAAGTSGPSVAAGAWYAALAGYCAANAVFMLNRNIDAVSSSKPAMLCVAAACGLAVPPTLVGNGYSDLTLLDPAGYIAKPVGGGSYVMELGPALEAVEWIEGASASPALVQPRLSYPERRVYRIGSDYFAFDIASSTVDSRLDPHCVITPLPLAQLPPDTVSAIARLTDRIRCDFCAIDLKTDPATGGLIFLELNNSPMFVGYDRTCGGAMAEAMLRYLQSRASAK